ncbi:MAG: hypothetical protein GF408_00120 [Candidatus Omnitrophica bacterium]|nr:hypothetical protein [Candidatus Omnitrophota bacterium]
MELQYTFATISLAIAKLFVLMLIGYLVYHFKLIGSDFLDTLSLLLVRLIFPALIISKTVTNFGFDMFPLWWAFPLAAMAFSVAGMLMGGAVFKLIGGDASGAEFSASCGFQNCGYLPMNLILFAFSGAASDRLLIYLFLFILGFNILMWSLVPLFLKGAINKGFSPRVFINPPVAATLISLLWVALMGKGNMPNIILDPLRQLGQSAFPIAMITLGAYLSRYQAHLPDRKKSLISAVLVKIAIFPLLVLPLVVFMNIPVDVKFFLFLQAIMPTAVSLVVIGSYTGADNRFFSSVIFYSHLAAIFTIPVWIAVFNIVVKG